MTAAPLPPAPIENGIDVSCFILGSLSFWTSVSTFVLTCIISCSADNNREHYISREKIDAKSVASGSTSVPVGGTIFLVRGDRRGVSDQTRKRHRGTSIFIEAKQQLRDRARDGLNAKSRREVASRARELLRASLDDLLNFKRQRF